MATEGRVQRVASELKKVISLILRSRVKDLKLASATITEVEVSKDLSFAKVYYTCLVSEDIVYISKAFTKSKGFFRTSIAKSLNLRVVPDLKFIYDTSLEYGMQMEEKISKALDADAKFISQGSDSLEDNYRKAKEDDVEKLR
ncbi:30S ribosome-binding factor RbfA [Allofrancisella guangzhouensis]|uniref:Ribosome-binding factor A n=1 Tax=Allofrancisella guangzhouensis TaxID=594679 RepID=A0A0A8E254_9GAMM|nr:30S ribosome-binding factor RbfA [Allofrancisella guangzhouensis]AJC48295.1 ribosome-binding factor A [Allofrancisella guangzhouensis]MBK2026619.1 30S ribosome-binding factor RbfA [Allofrancisella guangzhouensis]MBK2043806.1 30S ribosome-binding factor RbfA [Allofrancisella guangzhouensis]MBK2045606.1 30S ribosome-binding factor RbfA [Allofrancisella guangzhouensis]